MGISPPQKLLYIVFITSVSFLQAKEWTILTNEKPFSISQDQLKGCSMYQKHLKPAVNNVSAFGGT